MRAQIKREAVAADAADPKKKVFVKFLSERDADVWDSERMKEEDKFDVSTVYTYDLPKTAAYLADRVKRQATEKLFFGTFYDPLAGHPDPGERVASRLAPTTGQSSNPAVNAKVQTSSDGKVSMTLSQPASAAWKDRDSESRRLLRLQVQDFIKWLQAQGAI